jgi:hypothetical protein
MGIKSTAGHRDLRALKPIRQTCLARMLGLPFYARARLSKEGRNNLSELRDIALNLVIKYQGR